MTSGFADTCGAARCEPSSAAKRPHRQEGGQVFLAKRAWLTVSAACLITAALASPALAGDPKVGTGGGTGIDETVAAPTTPQGLGYTSEYAASKEAQYQSTVAALEAGQISVMAAPSNGSLAGWVSYHQQTNYNCLPAVGQSILHWEFGGYVTPSIAAKQGTAAQETGSITKGMLTTTIGTNDNNALAYVNGQYAANGSSWRYVATNNTVESEFKARIYNQIGVSYKPLYVRVDLTNINYAWHQTSAAQHATAAIAYKTLATNTTIDDPFTHTLSSGACSASWDSGAASTSCNWVDYSTHKYFLSKDVVRNGVNPIWF